MTQPRPRATLPRICRLVRGADFLRLRERGERLSGGCLVLNWMGYPGPVSRAGFITSRKVGCAVVRNRARRLFREVFRKYRSQFPQSVSLVMVARPSIAGLGFAEVERDFLRLARRGGLLPAAVGVPAPAQAGSNSGAPGVASPVRSGQSASEKV